MNIAHTYTIIALLFLILAAQPSVKRRTVWMVGILTVLGYAYLALAAAFHIVLFVGSCID